MASFDLGNKNSRVLVIVSDADHFDLKKPDGSTSHEETGFFLQELTKPLQQILDAGYNVTVSVLNTSQVLVPFLTLYQPISLRPRLAKGQISTRFLNPPLQLTWAILFPKIKTTSSWRR
jgi:hypothetical protein